SPGHWPRPSAAAARGWSKSAATPRPARRSPHGRADPAPPAAWPRPPPTTTGSAPMAIAVSATWTARPGMEGIVRDALAKFVPAAREEPGCRLYVVHQDTEQPTVFRLFEIYDDDAAIEAHLQSAHFRQYAQSLA